MQSSMLGRLIDNKEPSLVTKRFIVYKDDSMTPMKGLAGTGKLSVLVGMWSFLNLLDVKDIIENKEYSLIPVVPLMLTFDLVSANSSSQSGVIKTYGCLILANSLSLYLICLVLLITNIPIYLTSYWLAS